MASTARKIEVQLLRAVGPYSIGDVIRVGEERGRRLIQEQLAKRIRRDHAEARRKNLASRPISDKSVKRANRKASDESEC